MARDYAKVTPDFWTGQTGREIRACGPAAQVVAMYLLTCRHANMIGVYYLSLLYITSDTGIGTKDAIAALEALDRIGFAHFDPRAEMIYVPEFARYQIAESLKPGDKQVRGVIRELQKIAHPYAARFHAKYAEAFCLPDAAVEPPLKALPRGSAITVHASEGPSKPEALRSQDQEQEQEQEQEQFARPTPRPALPADRIGQDVAAHLLAEIRSHSPGYQLEAARQGEWAHLAVSVMKGGVSAADLKAAATHAHRGNPRFWASKVLGMRQLAEKAQDLLVEARTSKLERGAQGSSSPASPPWREIRNLASEEDRLLARGETPSWWADPIRWTMTTDGKRKLIRVNQGVQVAD